MTIRLIRNAGLTGIGSKQDDQAAICATLVFRALSQTQSDVAILRAGERPMLMTGAGRVAIARQPLTNPALDSLIDYLLPASMRGDLDRQGSVRHARPDQGDVAGEQFTIIATTRGPARMLEIVRSTAARRPEIDEVEEISHLLPARSVSRSDLELPSADELWPSAERALPGRQRLA